MSSLPIKLSSRLVELMVVAAVAATAPVVIGAYYVRDQIAATSKVSKDLIASAISSASSETKDLISLAVKDSESRQAIRQVDLLSTTRQQLIQTDKLATQLSQIRDNAILLIPRACPFGWLPIGTLDIKPLKPEIKVEPVIACSGSQQPGITAP